jgi:hypothetical protein
MVVGARVCVMHGQNGRVRASVPQRSPLLSSSPRRHVVTRVLLDAVHTADGLAQQAQRELGEHGVSRRTMRQLVEAVVRSGALARTALRAQAEDRAARFTEQQIGAIDGALTKLLRRLGRDDAEGRQALANVIEDIAEGDAMLTSVVAYRRQPDEVAGYVADILESVLVALGLDRDEWAREQVASALWAIGRSEQLQPSRPPRAWWHAMAQREAAELGHPDPTADVAAIAEILPPARAELTDGSESDVEGSPMSEASESIESAPMAMSDGWPVGAARPQVDVMGDRGWYPPAAWADPLARLFRHWPA